MWPVDKHVAAATAALAVIVLGGCVPSDTSSSSQGSCVVPLSLSVGEQATYSFSERGGPELLLHVEVTGETAAGYALNAMENGVTSRFLVANQCAGALVEASDAVTADMHKRVVAVVTNASLGWALPDSDSTPGTAEAPPPDFVLQACHGAAFTVAGGIFPTNRCSYTVQYDTGTVMVADEHFDAGTPNRPFNGLAQWQVSYPDALDSRIGLIWWNGK
jgi:hypothetical protein